MRGFQMICKDQMQFDFSLSLQRNLQCDGQNEVLHMENAELQEPKQHELLASV